MTLTSHSDTSLYDFVDGSRVDEEESGPSEKSNRSENAGDDGPDDTQNSQQGTSNEEDEDKDYPDKCVVPYKRVSSHEQKRDGQSLESQESELTSIIENDPNIRQFTSEVISDEGETGRNFDREGIKKVMELVQNEEVTHVMVDSVDRLGRNVSRTVRFAEIIQVRYDVKIMTRTREHNIAEPGQKLHFVMLAAMAEYTTEVRGRAAFRSKADKFLKNKCWKSWYGSAIPFGYDYVDEQSDETWIEKVDYMEPVVQDMFENFIKTETYAEVRRRIEEKHEERLIKYNERVDYSDDDDDEDEECDGNNDETEEDPDDALLSKGQIKRVVGRPLYRGEPTLPVFSLEHHESLPSVTDPDLAFVSEEQSTRAENIVQEINNKYSAESEGILSEIDYAEKFGSHIVETASEDVRLICNECGSPLEANGQTILEGDLMSRWYTCSSDDCDYETRWPDKTERDIMRMLHESQQLQKIL